MSAKSNFKAAVIRAKRLYKTGRYKTFADAVKAAYKKRSVGAVKRSAKKKPARKKKHHTWGVVKKHERRVAGTLSGAKSKVRSMIKDRLDSLVLRKFHATKKLAKRKLQKEISKAKSELNKYQ